MQRWKVWTAFLTVFAAGVIVGVAGLGLTMKMHMAPPKDPAEFHRRMRQHMVEEFMETVRPDPDRKAEAEAVLNSIFDRLDGLREDTRPQIEAILKDGKEQLKSLLTPEQAARFDRMIEEKRRPGPFGPPPPPPM